MAEPLILYRLWCGKKRYSSWTADLEALDRLGRRHGIIYSNGAFGPLTWLERGERKYAHAKTVAVGKGLAPRLKKSVPVQPAQSSHQAPAARR